VRENTQAKVKVTNPIVFSDGDDRARSVFKLIKNLLIYPYVDLDIEYYDLSSKNRDVHKTSQESKEAL
jgi:isocitrate dehydrogenase